MYVKERGRFCRVPIGHDDRINHTAHNVKEKSDNPTDGKKNGKGCYQVARFQFCTGRLPPAGVAGAGCI
jgi:hypothetical protein